MVSQASDFVSLDRIKRELRYENTNEFDELLSAQRDTAVEMVSRELDYPIVNKTEVIQVRPYSSWIYNSVGDRPLEFYATLLQSVNSVSYWTTSGSLNEAPDGELTTLGRLSKLDGRAFTYHQWPSSDGWPERMPSSPFHISVTRGLQAQESLGLQQAVILLTRAFFNSHSKMIDLNTLKYLLGPYRQYNG